MAVRRKKLCRKQLKEKGENEESFRDWAELPEVLLEMILERLPLLDSLVFGGICKSWRNILTNKSHPDMCGFPWLMQCGQNYSENRTCLSIVEKKFWEMKLPKSFGKYCWGSYQDWLIVADVSSRTMNEISFLNPFSNAEVHLPDVINFYCHIVLSLPPTEKNCVVMLVARYCKNLRFWSSEAQEWRNYYFDGPHYQDAVFYKGCFYLLTNDYNLEVIDATSVAGDEVVSNRRILKVGIEKILSKGICLRRYLVESCGELLLVCRFFQDEEPKYLTSWFQVFKLDTCQTLWKRVDNIGDRNLFIGKCCSRSFSATELGFRSNCIHFLNDSVVFDVSEWNDEFSASNFDNLGIFSLEDESFLNPYRGSYPDSWAPIWITAPVEWYMRSPNL